MFLVERAYGIERVTLDLVVHTFGIGKIQNGIALAAEHHAIVNRGQKARTPVRRAPAGTLVSGTEDNKAGQIP